MMTPSSALQAARRQVSARARGQQGFTLIELMVVIIVIGLLAAYAVSAYQESVRKTRRTIAQGCLMEQAQYMERARTTSLSYNNDGTGAEPAILACTQDVSQFYRFEWAVNPTPTAFTVQATPLDAQEDDVCGTMTLDQTGLRVATGPDAATCW